MCKRILFRIQEVSQNVQKDPVPDRGGLSKCAKGSVEIWIHITGLHQLAQLIPANKF